jgi:hypothetical protein
VQPTKKLLKKSRGGCSDYDLIDIQEQVGRVSHGGDVGCKPLVPCARGLLQTIEGLVQTTDTIRTRLVTETRGLLAIHHFLDIAMKKGILDIKLSNRP